MHYEPGIKIIYLKNHKYYEPAPTNDHYSLSSSNNQEPLPYQQRVSNLVNLSAKIQHQSSTKNIEIQDISSLGSNLQEQQQYSGNYKSRHPITEKSEFTEEQKGRKRRAKDLSIGSTGNQSLLGPGQKEKSIIQLLGKIEFKRINRQKKAYRNMSSIKNAYISETNNQTLSPNKSGEINRPQTQKNKSELSQDFHNFIENKRIQETALQLPKLDDKELRRIKKLATINPEQITSANNLQPLSLFHFQVNNKSKKATTNRSMRNSRNDNFNLGEVLKMLMQPSKQRDEFEWSKVGCKDVYNLKGERNESVSKDNNGNTSNINQ